MLWKHIPTSKCLISQSNWILTGWNWAGWVKWTHPSRRGRLTNHMKSVLGTRDLPTVDISVHSYCRVSILESGECKKISWGEIDPIGIPSRTRLASPLRLGMHCRWWKRLREVQACSVLRSMRNSIHPWGFIPGISMKLTPLRGTVIAGITSTDNFGLAPINGSRNVSRSVRRRHVLGCLILGGLMVHHRWKTPCKAMTRYGLSDRRPTVIKTWVIHQYRDLLCSPPQWLRLVGIC
jgi:hypothetical protein